MIEASLCGFNVIVLVAPNTNVVDDRQAEGIDDLSNHKSRSELVEGDGLTRRAIEEVFDQRQVEDDDSARPALVGTICHLVRDWYSHSEQEGFEEEIFVVFLIIPVRGMGMGSRRKGDIHARTRNGRQFIVRSEKVFCSGNVLVTSGELRVLRLRGGWVRLTVEIALDRELDFQGPLEEFPRPLSVSCPEAYHSSVVEGGRLDDCGGQSHRQ